jgi:hypothetical protein
MNTNNNNNQKNLNTDMNKYKIINYHIYQAMIDKYLMRYINNQILINYHYIPLLFLSVDINMKINYKFKMNLIGKMNQYK